MSKVILRSFITCTGRLPDSTDCNRTRQILQLIVKMPSSQGRLVHSVAPDAQKSKIDGETFSSKQNILNLNRQNVPPESENLLVKSAIPNVHLPSVHFYRRSLPHSCISFTSDAGKQIFRESLLAEDMNCYFQLASQYRTQDEPAFCGLSTLVMVLNTLEVDPKKIWKGPWRWYHENMLDCCIPLAVVEKTGITMDQFACLAACNMLNVKMVRMDHASSEEDFRALVKRVVRSTDQVLVASYSREELDQTGDGHFSPIGGYNAKRDMVLIMDTARFKYPPHWVSLSLLFKAMQRVDKASDLSRGYFLLSKSNLSPGLIFRLSVNLSPVILQNKDSKMYTFIQSWERLLMTKTLTNFSSDTSAIADVAVTQLLHLLDTLDPDSFLLTAEVDQVYSREMSSQYGHDVRSLLLLIESLSLYQFIKEGCSAGRFSQASLQKSGSTERCASLGGVCEDNSHHLASKSVNTACMRLNLNVAESITPAHFLTMLLLAWPYHRCSGERLCTELHRYTSAVLSKPGSELLQNEAARLRQQLTSILSFCSSFGHEVYVTNTTA